MRISQNYKKIIFNDLSQFLLCAIIYFYRKFYNENFQDSRIIPILYKNFIFDNFLIISFLFFFLRNQKSFSSTANDSVTSIFKQNDIVTIETKKETKKKNERKRTIRSIAKDFDRKYSKIWNTFTYRMCVCVCVYAMHDWIVKSGAHTNFTIPQSMCTPVAFSPMKLTLLVVASLVALS